MQRQLEAMHSSICSISLNTLWCFHVIADFAMHAMHAWNTGVCLLISSFVICSVCGLVIKVYVFLSGFWRLSSEDLGYRWWPSASHSAWTRSRDFRYDGEFWELAPRFRQLWQDHPRVVPAYLCTCGCIAGAHSLHHLRTGVWTNTSFLYKVSLQNLHPLFSSLVEWAAYLHTNFW